MPYLESTVFKGSKSGEIVQSSTVISKPFGNQVLVKITHSGICGTDEHFRHSDMVLGHEGVGIVLELGQDVQGLTVGDVVGWGYTHKTCGRCEQCELGQDQYCPKRQKYGKANLNQGSFGFYALQDAAFLFKIPAGISSEHAAPLMCGGATVFEVMETYQLRPTQRIGVIGIGGLGHLAIQFLAKMGATVVVFSSTRSKEEEAFRLGATEFHHTEGVTRFEGVQPLDHLIVTTSSQPKWKPFLAILKPKATIFPLTVDTGPIGISLYPLVNFGFTIQGSSVASRAVHRRMLDFAARHQIQPIIEVFPMTKAGVQAGMDKLRAGKMRYRGVLSAQRAASL
ncbi:unnamed protein product [Mycena citricolor]|uniref:Enoyl reductase (ER) domain-containing protein n=1 Tax=Mycena citricolor TaxID=2018698 RepID=A0AAD2K3Z9_9AGAR|nr:unnamed protein product [Mycena citricolor]